MKNFNDLINSTDVSELESAIAHYSASYYTGESEITDGEFDALCDRLRALDPESEALKKTGWGYDPNSVQGKKIKHAVNMGSISRKPRDVSGIPENYNVVRVSAKLDGISMALYYENGILAHAVTRGNGSVGIDVTEKIHKIKGVPHRIDSFNPYKRFNGVIRGECIIDNQDWEKYKNLVPNASGQRNSAAGIINADDSEYLPYVTFVAYKILASNIPVENLVSVGSYLHNWGFNVVPYLPMMLQTLPKEQINKCLKELYDNYCEYFPCDGLVITDNKVSETIELENNDAVEIFYDEVAFKFDGETANTKVVDISWNLTRTNKLVPTIIVDTVHLSDADISRTSGFNAAYIRDNGIGIGAEVKLIRSGEVIPYIKEVLNKVTPILPKYCPICNSELVWEGVDLKCTNLECANNGRASVFNWIFNVTHVHGLGDATVNEFLETNMIGDIPDLYDEEADWEFPRTPSARDKITKMLEQLYGRIDPREAMCGLNIPRLGWASANKIIEAGVFDDLMAMVSERVHSSRVRDAVGNATYDSITRNRSALKVLHLIQYKLIEVEESPEESKGEVVITGTLSMKRADFEKIIKDAGYTPSGSIRKDTLYLITNDKNGNSSKNRKASELGITKVTEEEFLDIIKEN